MSELSKKEAAEYLGISLRALERYTQQGRVSVKYVKATRGRQARYDLAELNELKQQLHTPIHRPAVVNDDNAESLAPAPVPHQIVTVDDPSSLIDSLIALTDAIKSNPVFPIEKKLLLTLSDAQVLTGLGKATLKRAIKEGELKAIRLGGAWRIKNDDLTNYIKEL